MWRSVQPPPLTGDVIHAALWFMSIPFLFCVGVVGDRHNSPPALIGRRVWGGGGVGVLLKVVKRTSRSRVAGDNPKLPPNKCGVLTGRAPGETRARERERERDHNNDDDDNSTRGVAGDCSVAVMGSDASPSSRREKGKRRIGPFAR
ncbi:hypothetical protein F2P81_017533 [Scophthalmus maximus]|uniref:Uncharacterized protein n=1 Tax=Scophthalmus maximus TaxID=52904 RepID=A0A6A4SKA4_SCOMX|nr:hypothetical protein F2P81_017533 [Scophthalmus maximus]